MGRPLGLESAQPIGLVIPMRFKRSSMVRICIGSPKSSREIQGPGIWYPSHGACSRSVLDELKHAPHEFVAIKAVDAFTASSSLSEKVPSLVFS